MKKLLYLLVSICTVCSSVNAQEIFVTDPIRAYKTFYDVGLTVGFNRVNTNFTHFNTGNGNHFNFNKGEFLPTTDANLTVGWLFKDKESDLVWILKTGLNFLARSAKGQDRYGRDLMLSTSYLQLPVQGGFRIPLNYNRDGKYFFKAVDLSIGAYVAMPMTQKFSYSNNLDLEMQWLPFNYLRFGTISEISFSAFNKKGNGHKFGLRTSIGFPKGMIIFKDSPNKLYPFYLSSGIFYNFINIYK